MRHKPLDTIVESRSESKFSSHSILSSHPSTRMIFSSLPTSSNQTGEGPLDNLHEKDNIKEKDTVNNNSVMIDSTIEVPSGNVMVGESYSTILEIQSDGGFIFGNPEGASEICEIPNSKIIL